MPRPPSKHGLERKYKPWRRGKSANATKSGGGSLRHQLRGQERLLKKLLSEAQQQKQDDPSSFDQRQQVIEARIAELKEEISKSQMTHAERQHAKESHGKRFLERQRLTRLERSTRKLFQQQRQSNDNKERYEKELLRIALDQVYVAHYPHSRKYMPLFRNGIRVVDQDRRKLMKRSKTRAKILESLDRENEVRVTWIAKDQYERLPKKWSVEREESTFSFSQGGSNGNNADNDAGDDRFAMSETHSAMVDAADELEKEEEAKERAESDDGSAIESASESEESDNDDADPLTNNVARKPLSEKNDTESVSASDSSDSSDSETSSSSDSDSSSSSSSDDESDSDDNDQSVQQGVVSEHATDHDQSHKRTAPSAEDEFGDFFTSNVEDVAEVFAKAKEDKPDYFLAQGDKSQGWATQRQRPGQFKKRRVRN